MGFGLAIGLWWPYLSELSTAGEDALVRAKPGIRPALTRDAYTLGHFPLVAGVVCVARARRGRCSRSQRWSSSALPWSRVDRHAPSSQAERLAPAGEGRDLPA